jgi:hypothetical protein
MRIIRQSQIDTIIIAYNVENAISKVLRIQIDSSMNVRNKNLLEFAESVDFIVLDMVIVSENVVQILFFATEFLVSTDQTLTNCIIIAQYSFSKNTVFTQIKYNVIQNRYP